MTRRRASRPPKPTVAPMSAYHAGSVLSASAQESCVRAMMHTSPMIAQKSAG
eukprot:CAMPEP_0119080566 /NCGR_PEP_ID=MMETSP1178-20130426/112576_1 /TAXON_ID=33656 /ORGANISM="unid sp, Strain CCMP2000" /LENGTH=51 /DNA_ID=CAMNT_0007063183 /DNA_START=143 /DNA_END=294 /DNA_ORIENTATION=-